jgi:hypothetical protein
MKFQIDSMKGDEGFYSMLVRPLRDLRFCHRLAADW